MTINRENIEGSRAEILFQQELLDSDLRRKHNKRNWNPKQIKQDQLPNYLKCDPLLLRIFERLHYEDKNLLCIIVGETGSGKSFSAINIADKIDITPLGNGSYTKNFVVKCLPDGTPTQDTRIVFSASDFVRLIRSGLPKGSVIIWDEAGIGNDNTTWYDKKSRLVKHIMQSFRAQNLMVILTVPDEESIALATRRLVHLVLDVRERDEQFAKINIEWLQRNRRSKKTYRKTSVYESGGEITKIMEYMLRPLPKEIADPYLKLKQRVLGDLNKFYENEMIQMEKLQNIKSGKLEEENDKLSKFNVVKCVNLIKENVKLVLDEKGEPNKYKIIYFLAEQGFESNTANARTIIENLD